MRKVAYEGKHIPTMHILTTTLTTTLTTILAQASDNQEVAAFGALLALIAGFGMILVAGIVVVTLIGMW